MSNQPKFRLRKEILYTVLAAAGIGAFSWYNGDPHPSHAAGPETYIMYGIDSGTGQLKKHDLDTDQTTQIGPVIDSGQTVLHGIEASAYFPGFKNLYAFWNDSVSGLTHLVFVNKSTANATIIGQDLGEERITGAVAVNPPGTHDYDVYAMQEADTLPFEIVGGSVIPNIPLSARITVLGSAITYGGSYDLPVTVKVRTGLLTTHEPFGSYNSPASASVNDGQNPRSHVLPGVYNAGNPISVLAKSWVLEDSSDSGTQDSHWDVYMAVDSAPISQQVIILRHGDPVPNIPAFMDQAQVVEFLVEYIDHDTNTMDLGPNQAVYLFELGTTNMSSSAADFQDLVFLLTFSEAPEDLQSTTTSYSSISGTIKVNPNNSWKNRFELTKSNGSKIERTDLHEDAPIDGSGVLYSGPASSLRIRPTGNGTQNLLMIDGAEFDLHNSTTYQFDATGMNVTIRNDHVNGGKAMGHWWADITSSSSTDVKDGDGTDDPAANSQLIKVDQRTGEFETLMIMNRPYSGLASTDGQIFYAVSGTKVFKIDTVNQTETLLKEYLLGDFTGLGFAGSTLYAFNSLTDRLHVIDTTTGNTVGSTINPGLNNQGTIFFTPASIELLSEQTYD